MLSFFTSLYYELAITLSALLLLMVLDKIGHGIVLREIVAFLYSFTCVFMPMIGYKFYTYTNPLARIWVKYMPVPSSTYFPFALPAVTLFCLALTFPFPRRTDNEQGEGLKIMITRIRVILEGYKKKGLIMMGIGVLISFIIRSLPGGLQFFATLIFFGSFAGILYIYYTKEFPYRKWVYLLFTVFIVNSALNAGMFTIVAYMSITIFSFIFMGKKISLFKKIGFFLLTAFFLIVLQNVKGVYRKYTWGSEYQGSKAALFGDLFLQQLQKRDSLFENAAFFPVYTRVNQGYNVAAVMRKFPSHKQFDNGSNLALSFVSAFVPRFLWPDKPTAGGAFNMEYYTGYKIVGWSTNVGPLGEAYGSFGPEGGIVYMLLLGLFIRWTYRKVFKIANNIPLLICWIPVIFYQVISSSETDSLQIFNSIVKSGFFVWLIYKFLPDWMGVTRTNKIRVINRNIEVQ